MLNRALVCLAVLFVALPAWPAKKATIDELANLLRTMQKEKKSDAEVAAALKQIQLTEELVRDTMHSFAAYLPGTQSTEQIYVMEARTAALPPPAEAVSATAAPAPDAVKSILDKAADYVSNTYAQLPALTATKTVQRFQDNVEPEPPGSHDDPPADQVSFRQFAHFINSTDVNIATEHGAEKPAAEKDTTPWGANRMISIPSPEPSLAAVFPAAQAAGTLKWLRWQTIDGKQVAVFSFEIRKKSQLDVNVCCFPNEDAANTNLFVANVPGINGTDRVTQQRGDAWRSYKRNGLPYHGQFFIDPEKGAVVRMIVQPEFRSSELVHAAETRIDYAPVVIGGKSFLLPVKSFVNTEVMPYGLRADKSTVRCTYFVSEYKNHQAAAAGAVK